MDEALFYRLSTAILILALVLAFVPQSAKASARQWSVGILWLAVAGFGLTIALRWWSLGHGPFLSMYEILLSNVFSLGLVALLIVFMSPAARAALPVVVAVLAVLATWGLTVSDGATLLPPTYSNPWLWVHVGFGKPFLGFLLVATGLAVTIVWRFAVAGTATDTSARVATLWRCFSTSFVFESLMLIAGAVWARDAWGRYWQWDPLETWAFLTWVLAAMVLHLRATRRIPEVVAVGGVVVVFTVAFMTFFGFPYLSPAPHKGAV